MNKKQKIAIVSISSTVVVLLVVFFIFYISWANTNQGRIAAGVFLGELDLSGQTKSAALETITRAENEFKLRGVEFKYGEKSAFFPLKAESLSPDIPESSFFYADSVYYDNEKTVEDLIANDWSDFTDYLLNKLIKNKKQSIVLSVNYSSEVLEKWLNESFKELAISPEPAYFSLDKATEELINNPEKIGKEIDLSEAVKEFEQRLAHVDSEAINIKTKSKYPEVKQADLEPLREQVQAILNIGAFSVVFDDYSSGKKETLSFKISGPDIITWITPATTNNQLALSVNQEKVHTYLEEVVAPKVNQPVVLPRFEISESGKVSSWRTGENGREIDLEVSAANVVTSLSSLQSSSTLAIKELRVDDLEIENNFKIKEIVGTGHSNFAGSPVNRRHNIKVGAEAVHGLLIEPGQEFSLVKALGNIDAEAGYLPELVIKGNKTIPEYGGGLCQIATTLFRSALSSGLPITERRNHSYRVSYYEPAGTDAAVYDPWPDIRFLNDTNNYVLIQSRIDGNDIYFDFWGTKDGREATTTDPVIYNIVKPPATKIIETDDLAPGEKKCTERAHNGADAYFDYIVTYPEGATTTPRQEVRFRSHYVPWQEVCLVGKTATAPATTTPASSETTATTTSLN